MSLETDTAVAATKLALHLPPAVLTKAAEYSRIAHSRHAAAALGGILQCLPYFCLQLACETLRTPFSPTDCRATLKIPFAAYSSALSNLRNLLGVAAPPVSFSSLGVRLGATQMVDTAHGMMEAFRENYGAGLSVVQIQKMAWDDADLVAAVFYVCCKSAIKLAKREVSTLCHNVTQFNKYVKLVENHCKDEISELKQSAASATETPSKTRKRKAAAAAAEQSENDNQEEEQSGEEQGAQSDAAHNQDKDPEESAITTSTTAATTPSTPTGRRRVNPARYAIKQPESPTTPSKRPRMGASSAPSTPLSTRRRGRPPGSAATTPGRGKKVGNAAASATPAASAPNSGINPMISRVDPLHTKKYRDYVQWRDTVLQSLPAETIKRYTVSAQ
ncbi:hypothetical protein DFJ77DRAFT_462746 [Powellomyces hirtus]|nr:hypothetical protein DFJ77DRAFT_462746 [Powellomyces hirtus]